MEPPSSLPPSSSQQLPTTTAKLVLGLRFDEGSTVIPGDRLGTIRRLKAGKGCYVRHGHIYSTLVGKLQLTEEVEEVEVVVEAREVEEKEGKRLTSFVCNVVPVTPSPSPSPSSNAPATAAAAATTAATGGSTSSNQLQLPQPPTTASSYVLKPGQIVLGRVVRITPQNAVVTIHAAENVGALPIGQEGAIRTEDVRALASEQVQISESFQPGDLVAARVISLGDSRRYFLSTAETELGVIRAIASQHSSLMDILGSGSLQKRKREDRVLQPVSFKEMEDPITGLKEKRKVAKPLLLLKKMSS